MLVSHQRTDWLFYTNYALHLIRFLCKRCNILLKEKCCAHLNMIFKYNGHIYSAATHTRHINKLDCWLADDECHMRILSFTNIFCADNEVYMNLH